MFSLRAFIKSGMLKAVGHMADYQIILNSAGWHEKGVLTEDDLAEIQTAIEAQYIVEDNATESDVEEETEATSSTLEPAASEEGGGNDSDVVVSV